jgi:AraC-like DNA-binding protein
MDMNTNTPTKKERQETLLNRRETVERVIKTVSQSLDEPMTMMDMARIAYTSPFHFSRIFHQVTGLPPSQFLYALRLEAAKRLLLTTEMSVTEICFAVGYNSLGTFTSRFTELVGLSPREFRHLAVKIRSFDWDGLFHKGWQNAGDQALVPSLKGVVTAPDNFEGLIFIGLFNQMIPQSEPVSGTMLTRGGTFSLHSLPEGEFYLLAAALPRTSDALEYLLPDFSELLVGLSEDMLRIQSGHTNENIEINLRHLEITDPPVLLALPNLLVKGLATFESAIDGEKP